MELTILQNSAYQAYQDGGIMRALLLRSIGHDQLSELGGSSWSAHKQRQDQAEWLQNTCHQLLMCRLDLMLKVFQLIAKPLDRSLQEAKGQIKPTKKWDS